MEIRFFRCKSKDYNLGEEKFFGTINSDFVPRKGDFVSICEEDSFERVINTDIFYRRNEDGTSTPFVEVMVLDIDKDAKAHHIGGGEQ